MNKWMIFTIIAVAVISVGVSFPAILATNTFLSQMLSHESLAIMVVVVTVTFATVANVNLSLNRYVSEIKKPEAKRRLKDAAADLRKELNENAWIIFGSFIFLAILVFLGGTSENDDIFRSVLHGSLILVISLQLLSLWDVYATMIGVSNMSLDQDDYEA